MKKIFKIILIILTIVLLSLSFGCKATKGQIKKDFQTIEKLLSNMQNVTKLVETSSLYTQNGKLLKEKIEEYVFVDNGCNISIYEKSLSENPGIGVDVQDYEEKNETSTLAREDALGMLPTKISLSYEIVEKDYTRKNGNNETEIAFVLKNDKASEFLKSGEFEGSNIVVRIKYTKTSIYSLKITYTTKEGNAAKNEYALTY